MIWIILFVLCIALLAWAVQTYDDEFAMIVGNVGTVIFGVVIGIQAASACMADYEFAEEKTEIQMMRAGIAEIKASIYDSKRGHMFDAQNMSQSAKLSEYTAEVVKREAKFNKDLLGYKNALSSTTSLLVGRRLYIPNAVKDIQGF